MKDDQSASPYLHVYRTRGHPVLVHHAFSVEVGEGRPFMHVRQHGRVIHPEPAVRSTSAPTVGEHIVDGVVTFAQSFRAVLVGGSETIVRLATQPHASVTGPLNLEQARCPLVERSLRLSARLVPDPRSIGESTAYVLVPMFVAKFGAIRTYLLNPLRAGSHIRPTPKNANVACPLQASSPGPNSTREPSFPALLISSTSPWVSPSLSCHQGSSAWPLLEWMLAAFCRRVRSISICDV